MILVKRRNVRLWFLTLIFSMFLLFIASGTTNAQGVEDPPRPITVTTATGISFGAFSHTSGGTITIDAAAIDGNRIKTGSILFLGMGVPVQRASFTINGNAGTVVNLSFSPNVSLGSLSMIIDSTYPLSPFPLQITGDNLIYVGGTLTVGAGSAAGTYNGTFTIDFIQNWE